MFTSDTEKNRQRYLQTTAIYLIVSLFCILFGAIYEHFSHEVYSFYMLYAFVVPFAGGLLPFYLLMFFQRAYPAAFTANCYHAGIATLTVGSVVEGALEIYGTSNPLTVVYWVVGFTLVGIALLSYLLLGVLFSRTKRNNMKAKA